MAKLYPPQINGTIPAFYSGNNGTTNIVVPFSMNRAVSLREINGMELKIKSLTGTLIGIVASSLIDEKNMEVTFNVSSLIKNFTIGSYYKLQVAYKEKVTNDIGYYSTVGIIKFTARPSVYIDGLSLTKTNNNKFVYVGVYKQDKDPTEKMYSSRFIVYDSNSVFYDSGEKIHNNTDDELRNEVHETLKMPIELEINKFYTISFEVTTSNGITIRTNRYKIIHRKSLDPSIQAKLLATLNYDNGYVLLTLDDKVDRIISGTFVISRSCNINNWVWETIKDFQLTSTPPDDFRFEDRSIEQGVVYKYSVQQYNSTNNIYSNRIISNEIVADFEDAFLYDGERQLRIRFDPKISSFKTDLQETKTETIGHQYPFFTRNAHINYKEFPISGLISYLMDDNELFLTKEELGIELVKDRSSSHYNTSTQLTSRNFSAERIFKLKVLDWLNDGKIKAFRSPGEGNYLVRLMSVSLSPNDTLSRMLHTFSCQAYEVAEYNLENLASYGIYNPIETTGFEKRWETIDMHEKILEQNYTANNRPNWLTILSGGNFVELFIVDMNPGDRIKIDGEEIEIGTTGSYRVKDNFDPFHKVEIQTTIQSGLLTYSYIAQTKDSFVPNIESFEEEDVPCVQFVGNSYVNKINSINLLDGLQDVRTTVLNINLLKVMKRPVIDGFLQVNESASNPLQDLVARVQSLVNRTPNGEFTLTTSSGEQIVIKNYDNTWNRPYELPIYQLRASRIDKREQFTEYDVLNIYGVTEHKIYKDYKPYSFEQYYVDKHMDRFYPYIGYYFDPYKGQIFETKDDLFRFYINQESIDVADTESWKVRNLDPLPELIILNNGVYAELSYTKQTISYAFENPNSNLKNNNAVKMRQAYELNQVAYLLAKDCLKNYSQVPQSLIQELQAKYPLGSKYINSSNYVTSFYPLIVDVFTEFQTIDGKSISAAEKKAQKEAVLQRYYLANSVEKGINILRTAADNSYKSYMEALNNAIQQYNRGLGIT